MSPDATRLRANVAPPCATMALPGSCLSRSISSRRSPDATRASRHVAPAGVGGAARIASSSARVVPLREKTTFGMSFIVAAKSASVDDGQYVTQPAKLRLPTIGTPTSDKVRATQAFDSAPLWRKIHSFSPFGPATKPSIDTLIFRISFLMALLPSQERRTAPSETDNLRILA